MWADQNTAQIYMYVGTIKDLNPYHKLTYTHIQPDILYKPVIINSHFPPNIFNIWRKNNFLKILLTITEDQYTTQMNIWNYSDPLFGFFSWFFFHVLKLSPFDIGQTELIGLSLIQSSLINGHFTVHWFPMDYLPLDQLTTNYLLSLWPAVSANKGTTCAVYWIHVTCWQTGNQQVFTGSGVKRCQVRLSQVTLHHFCTHSYIGFLVISLHPSFSLSLPHL